MSANSKNGIIGQENLTNYIDNSTIDTFPHSLLLLGDEGCGKHLLCLYIKDHLNLEMVELDNKLDSSIVEEISTKPYPCLYMINLDEALPKVQNNLLKIIEEPPVGAFIIALSSDEKSVLSTIINRCDVWRFNNYSRAILSHFVENNIVNSEQVRDILYGAFTTPGQIIEAQNHQVLEMNKLATTMIDKIEVATIPNVLSIVDKFAWKEEKGLFNPDIFVKVLNYTILDRIKQDPNPRYIKQFKVIFNLKNKLKFSIVKSRVFTEFLFDLREASL